MSEIRVAARYALALFNLAEEKDLLEKVNSDAEGFIRLIQENRGFDLLLKSPVVRFDKKEKIIDKLMKEQVNSLTFEFMKIVLRKRRELVLGEIFKQFQVLYRKHKNIIEANLSTAYPVNDSIK